MSAFALHFALWSPHGAVQCDPHYDARSAQDTPGGPAECHAVQGIKASVEPGQVYVRTAMATRNVHELSGLLLGYAHRCAVLTVVGPASLCSGRLCKHAVDITAASRGMYA
jgi:hypothetical protein